MRPEWIARLTITILPALSRGRSRRSPPRIVCCSFGLPIRCYRTHYPLWRLGKSNHAWGKDKAGTGYWNREKHELLLIGTRGDIPCPAPGQQWDSLIMAPRGKQSEKPEVFLQMIEEYFPNLPKIELNRRGPPRPKWSAWGNETEPAKEAAE